MKVFIKEFLKWLLVFAAFISIPFGVMGLWDLFGFLEYQQTIDMSEFTMFYIIWVPICLIGSFIVMSELDRV